MEKTGKIRTRFAPSPTGSLHLGGARTALYNWLFARHNHGKFILRIEDTDQMRSSEEAVGVILDGLKWLGLDWDEGPYFQMKKLAEYGKYAQQLLREGKAYYCFCTPEELKQRREESARNKSSHSYNGCCRGLTTGEIEAYKERGRKPAIRLTIPESGKTIFTDIIRGDVEFENALLDDFVILKSTGGPTYNFAVVVDDHDMCITHVIRGDDHISNTPKQLLVYNALGWDIPLFSHIPMIMGNDGGRLSKRHNATAITQYRDEGYLPEATINYLALLGWSTEDSQQIFSVQELIDKFTLKGCGKASAVFDIQKLQWMNGEYIRKNPLDRIVGLSMPYLQREGLINDRTPKEYINKTIALAHERIKLISDVPSLTDFFFKEDIALDEKAVKKVLVNENVADVLSAIRDEFKNLDDEDFKAGNLEDVVRCTAEGLGLKTGQVFHPVRVAVSGRTFGPGLFEMLEVLGREKVIKRIDKVLNSGILKGGGGII